MLGVDKQAMVEDWLNPDGIPVDPSLDGGFPVAAPQVQFAELADASAAQPQLKMSKVGVTHPCQPGHSEMKREKTISVDTMLKVLLLLLLFLRHNFPHKMIN